jgi:hypothetical protein
MIDEGLQLRQDLPLSRMEKEDAGTIGAMASSSVSSLGVRYNTASKWIERMEEGGFVVPANHVGRRETYRYKDGSPLQLSPARANARMAEWCST